MLRIVHIEEIEELLLLLPALVEQQEQRSANFVSNVGVWLHSLEKAFAANRLYQAGNIATLRSGLVAAEQGHVPTGLEFRGRPSRWRVLSAAASQAMQRAAEVASTLIAENRPRLAEAERVVQQIVAVALSRGLIATRKEEVSNTQYLRLLRDRIVSSGDIENAVVRLEGLVGPHDALILLDRALSPNLDVTSQGTKANK